MITKIDLIRFVLSKGLPGLSQASDEQVLDIARVFNIAKYSREHCLYVDGFDCDKVFLIASGSVKSVREKENGEVSILEIYFPGEFIEENRIFNDLPMVTAAITMTDSLIMTADKKVFQKLCRKHENLAAAVRVSMERRLERAMKRINVKSLYKNIAAYIRDTLPIIANRYGYQQDENAVVLEFSQFDLANYLDVARETVNRELSAMKKNGLVKTKRKKIILLDKCYDQWHKNRRYLKAS